jgi:hypothetical protein
MQLDPSLEAASLSATQELPKVLWKPTDTVPCISIARQHLGEHIPAEAKARNNMTSIARQRITKNACLTTEALLFAWSVQSGYIKEFRS